MSVKKNKRACFMKKMKQCFRGVVSIILFVFISMAVFNQALISVEAKAWTKKSVQKELKKLKKETNIFAKKYKKKDAFIVLLAGVVRKKPYIILDGVRNNMLFIVKNSKNLFEFDYDGYKAFDSKYLFDFDYDGYKAVIGVVKLTGKEKVFKNEYYTEVEALKGSKEFVDLLYRSIILNQALQNKIGFTSLNYFALEGEEASSLSEAIQWSFPDDEYNGIKWEVKNRDILSIDKKGEIKAKKVGKTTITAKTTVSEKKTKANFYVLPNNLTFSEEEYYFKFDEEESYPKMFLSFNRELPKGTADLLLNIRTDSNIVAIEKVTDKGVWIRLYGEGKAEIILTDAGEEEEPDSSRIYGKCEVTVEENGKESRENQL